MACAIIELDNKKYEGQISSYTSVSYANYYPQLTFTFSNIDIPTESIGKTGRLKTEGYLDIQIDHDVKIMSENTAMVTF